jgi:hypothetical protein
VRVGERIGARVGQAEGVIQLAIDQQPAIGGDYTAAKLEYHTAVEIEPQRPSSRFTRQVHYHCSPWTADKLLTLYPNPVTDAANHCVIGGMRV